MDLIGILAAVVNLCFMVGIVVSLGVWVWSTLRDPKPKSTPLIGDGWDDSPSDYNRAIHLAHNMAARSPFGYGPSVDLYYCHICSEPLNSPHDECPKCGCGLEV